MKDVDKGLGVKNMSDLFLKEIPGFCETQNHTKEQIKKYKMTERKIFEKYANLSEDKLSEKSKKNVYVKNVVMSTVIERCRGEKKEVKEKQIDLQKKPDDSRL